MKNCANPALSRFNYLVSETDAVYHEAAQRLNLSDSGMMILYTVVCSGGECLLSDIARLSGVSRQTIHSALKKLEADGVICTAEGGGRKKTVRLTGRGRELAERTVLRIIVMENEILDSWSEEERSLFLRLLERYLDQVREKIRGI